MRTPPQSVVMEREMPHPPEKVWRALTQQALIEDWLMANDFEPVEGRAFKLRTAPMPHWDGVVDGEVLEVLPHQRLVYRWVVGNDEAALRTVVTWTLTATDGGTQVRMEQTGFREDQRQNLKGAVWGWNKNLDAFERVLGEMA